MYVCILCVCVYIYIYMCVCIGNILYISRSVNPTLPLYPSHKKNTLKMCVTVEDRGILKSNLSGDTWLVINPHTKQGICLQAHLQALPSG